MSVPSGSQIISSACCLDLLPHAIDWTRTKKQKIDRSKMLAERDDTNEAAGGV
jgi:hypothetical protein